jgi:hypothetical protein
VDRPNTEFLTLRDVDEGGFLARGTGHLHVKTPAVYEPGGLYRVTRVAEDGVANTQAVLADDLGRLDFSVALGPVRLSDQHSALEAAGLFAFEDVRVSITLDPNATTDAPLDCPPVWVYPVLPCTR